MSQSNKPPRLLAAKQAYPMLGISAATWYRRVEDGSIEPGKKMGPKLKRWDEEYIISLARNGLPPPGTHKPDAAE